MRQLDAAGTGGGRLPGADTAGAIRLLRDACHRRRRGDQPDAVRDLCGAGAGVLEQCGDQRAGSAEQRRCGREGCEESRGSTDRNGDGGRTGRGGTESGRKRRSPGRGGSRSGGENGTGGRAGEERERPGRRGDPDGGGRGCAGSGQCGLCGAHRAERAGDDPDHGRRQHTDAADQGHHGTGCDDRRAGRGTRRNRKGHSPDGGGCGSLRQE